jgi:ubiquinone/menaquinone biosynthesis C-methylase UbiE
MNKFEQYKGQWGGKIESGEEMWWTEPHHKLFFRNPIRNFFGRLRFRNDVRHYFLIRYLEKILEHATSKPLVLDFGCGTGGVTISLAKYMGIPLVGFDIFPTQIQIATDLARRFENKSEFRLMKDDATFPLENNSVDAIVSGDVLGHVPDIPFTLKEWVRVLKKGGGISLFTEATYSEKDRSLMARLAKNGLDMCEAVPEHISLFPREELEKMFKNAGLEVVERKSANVFHWFFFPKDYVLLYQKFGKKPLLYYVSVVWNAVLKILPFYPVPIDTARLFLTRLLGSAAYGTSYFYLLRKI